MGVTCVQPANARGSTTGGWELLGEEATIDPQCSVSPFSPEIERQQLVAETMGGESDQGVIRTAPHHAGSRGSCCQ